MRAMYESLMGRAGWTKLDAVKNNRVIVMNYWMAKGCGKLVSICYTAKLLYPDKFQDMNPEEVSREWIERFQGVEYKGEYTYPEEERASGSNNSTVCGISSSHLVDISIAG